MPCRERRRRAATGGKLLCALGFLLALGLLRQGLALLNESVPAVGSQAALIADRQIDPSALFYTESPWALAAEKRVRELLRRNAAHAQSAGDGP